MYNSEFGGAVKRIAGKRGARRNAEGDAGKGKFGHSIDLADQDAGFGGKLFLTCPISNFL